LAPRNIAPTGQREIARLAYKFWLARCFQNGSPQEDWLRAPREVSRPKTRRVRKDPRKPAFVERKPEFVERNHPTVLVVADDADMFAMLSHILKGRGYRVLLSDGAASAARLLDLEFEIDCVMIWAGMADSERIELTCLRRGLDVLLLCGIVEAGVIRLRVPERHPEYAPRILIVEDEPAVRTLFERLLTEDGYHVTAVKTGRQALAAAQATTFDAIVMDLSLPDLDGVEAIRTFRSDFPWAKILAVSGYMSGCVPNISLNAGATAILEKPATAWELRRAVYRLLDSGP